MKFSQRLKYAAQFVFGGAPLTSFSTIKIGEHLIGGMQNTKQYVSKGYGGNVVVFSIISQTAQKFSTIQPYLYEVADAAAFKRYKALTPSTGPISKNAIPEIVATRRKALRVVESHPLADLLKRPNPSQAGAAFWENLMGFKMITGAGAAWVNRGPEGTSQEPIYMWCLPTPDLAITVKRGDYMQASGYVLQSGYVLNLQKEDVLYWKYPNYDWNANGSHLYGMAPLRAAEMVATERSKADKTSATMMQNQGSKGVIYYDGSAEQGLDTTERDYLQDRIDEEVNGTRNAGRVAMANAKLGYLDLGRSYQDSGLEVAKRMSKEDLCNAFGFPFLLLDSSKSTYENQEKAMKFFVTNKIIPEWCGLRDELNAWLKPMYKNSRNLWIEPDFSVLPELQEDLEKQATALSKLWQLAPNQVLDYLGWEKNPDPAMDKIYIPANLVPLDQVNITPDDINGDVEKLNQQGLNDYK